MASINMGLHESNANLSILRTRANEVLNIEKHERKPTSIKPIRIPETPTKESNEAITFLASDNLELVSRSGRKIKVKKFLDSDIDVITPTKRKHTKDTIDLEFEITNLGSDDFLKVESTLVELDHLIKASVGLSGAQPEKCLKHLYDMRKLDVTPLMLKKHPNCVETIKRLRRYVGNVKEWEMDETLQTNFNAKAAQIRTEAEDIYNGFKKLFQVSSEKNTFWEIFMEEVGIFREKTMHLTSAEMCSLVDEPKSC